MQKDDTNRNREISVTKSTLRRPLEPLSRGEWWRGAVLYQVYVRSFRDSSGNGVGDLRGVLEKLDHIAALGVDGFWLSPFYPSPQVDFGYDITDFTAVDPVHGTLDDLRALLAEAHGRGLRVLIDLVPDHTSIEHPAFVESRRDRDNPKADWFVWADAAPDGGPPNNWLSSFGGPAWSWEPRRSQYYYHPFLEVQPALNLSNPEVMREVERVMRFWLDLGVDGFRVDAIQCIACDSSLRSNPPAPPEGTGVHIGGGPNNPFRRQEHFFDRDVPEAFAIIERLRSTVDAYAGERVLIGELADVDSSRLSEKYTAEGMGFHAVYDFDLIQGPREYREFARLINHRSAFLRTGWLMNAFANHDSLRAVSNFDHVDAAPETRVAGAKLLLFLQTALKGGGILYQGDELGLPHPELAREDLRDPWGLNLWPDFEGRDGARTPFPWVADAPHAGFTDGDGPWIPLAEEHRSLAVDRQAADTGSVLTFVREWLAWRRRRPLLRLGGEHVHAPEHDGLLVWDRYGGERTLTLAANLRTEPQVLPQKLLEGRRVLPAPGAATERSDEGLPLPALGFAVLAAAGAPDSALEEPI